MKKLKCFLVMVIGVALLHIIFAMLGTENPEPFIAAYVTMMYIEFREL